MTRKAKATVVITAENKTTEALKAMERRFATTAKKMKKVGKALTAAVTVPAVIFGASAFNEFREFEAQMAKVKAVSGATGAEFKALEDNAKELGAATRFSASEVAGLQLEFSKLGFSGKEITKVTKATLALAQASGEDLAEAASAAGATLRSFEIPAKQTARVTDIMAASFSKSALDLEKWRESMKVAAPLAKAAGVEIEETAALLSVLADSGIAGSLAGTALKSVFNKIKKEGVPLQKTLEELGKKNLTLADAQKLVGERGQAALLILAKNTDKIKGLTEEYDNANGSAAKMAAIMDDTAEGAMARFGSAFSALQIQVGGIISRGLLPLLEAIGPLFIAFTTLDEHTQTTIVSTIALAAAIGPVLIGLGLLTSAMPKVIAGLKALTIAFKLAWVAALGPIGLVISLVGALGFAIAHAAGKTEKLTGTFDRALTSTERFLLTAKQGFHFAQIGATILATGLFTLIGGFLDLDRAIKDALAGGRRNMAIFGNDMVEMGNGIIRALNLVMVGFVDSFIAYAVSAFNGLVRAAENSVNQVARAFNKIAEYIPGAGVIDEIKFGEVKFTAPEFDGIDEIQTKFDTSFTKAGKNSGVLWAEGMRDSAAAGVIDLLDTVPDGSEFFKKAAEGAGDLEDGINPATEASKKLAAAIAAAEEKAGKLKTGLGKVGEIGRNAAASIGFAFDAMGKKAVQAIAVALVAGTATAEQVAEAQAIKTVQAYERGLAGQESSAQAAINKVFGKQDALGGGFGGGGFGQQSFGGFSGGFGDDFGGGFGGDFSIPGADELDQLRTYYDERLAILRERGLQETELARTLELQKSEALASIRQIQLSGYRGGFDSILSIMQSFGGKQSGIYRALFVVSKGFAVAEAIQAGIVATAKAAASAPPPANVPAIMFARLNAAANVAGILANNPSFEGGGFTGNGSRTGGVDGKGGFTATLHPNESIIDHSKGQGMGGSVTLNLTINGDPNPSVVAQIREEASNLALTKLANINNRKGARASALSRQR